ncbi:unnamed protein product, partial [Rotaria magnacalcarata]
GLGLHCKTWTGVDGTTWTEKGALNLEFTCGVWSNGLQFGSVRTNKPKDGTKEAL